MTKHSCFGRYLPTYCISLFQFLGGRRRKEGGFNGSELILNQLVTRPEKRRVGLVSKGPPARMGTEVLDVSGNTVGAVTSGGPSPVLATNIAMAYVPRKLSKIGTQLKLKVRNKTVDAKIVKMPFVPSHYYTQ